MEPTRIHSVDLLKCDVWEFPDKISLRIEAIGCSNSGGWKEPELVLVEDDDAPEGYYVLEFVAVPPDEASTQVETPIKTTYMFDEIPDDLVSIRVVAETNYKQKKVIDEANNEHSSHKNKKRKKRPKHKHKKKSGKWGSDDSKSGKWRKKRKPWDKPEQPPHDPDPKGDPCCCGKACCDGEVECLFGVDVWDDCITIYVLSNGHTKKEHFKWCLFKGCAGQQPFLLEFCRCVKDDHECEEPEVIPIEFSCEELCLEPGDKFVIRNPFCCDPSEPQY